jgi:lipoate---protein ligase
VRTGRRVGQGAVVLGSTQDRTLIDEERAEAAGIDVVRRSTGGGAVLVAPGAQVWLDAWVPRRHELWDPDIIRAAIWLGEVWAHALESLGSGPLSVHRGPATGGAWSELICFAGVGPGEVRVADAEMTVAKVEEGKIAGRKVTGLAQRRTASGARFHTSAPLLWDPALLSSLFSSTPLETGSGDGARLRNTAVGLRRLVTRWSSDVTDVDVIATVEDAVIAALP